MNTSQSPVAAEAPLFRAREIWLSGSKTTMAPAARAFSAVRSVELLSQTMISLSQPNAEKVSVAAMILRKARAMYFSSLNAGTMTEIFIVSSLMNERSKVKEQSTDETSRRIHVLVNINKFPAFARGATAAQRRKG